MGIGSSSSNGLTYGNGTDFAKISSMPFSLSSTYSVNTEDQVISGTIYRQNYFFIDAGLPYSRCTMFKRSLDYCLAERYSWDSKEDGTRCNIEREDYKNCYYHGKEYRFMTIWQNQHGNEEGERRYCKWMNNYDKEAYDNDGGDIIERAKSQQKWYTERGLKGPKFQGDWD